MDDYSLIYKLDFNGFEGARFVLSWARGDETAATMS